MLIRNINLFKYLRYLFQIFLNSILLKSEYMFDPVMYNVINIYIYMFLNNDKTIIYISYLITKKLEKHLYFEIKSSYMTMELK
jgi:hypothetical protein